MGRIRVDLLGSNYGYGYWSYNYYEKQLVFHKQDSYELEPWYVYELLLDLPAYAQKDTGSEIVRFSAGEKVYSLRSDGVEWVQIRNKDGLEGWVHFTDYAVDTLNMDMNLVFKGIDFFD